MNLRKKVDELVVDLIHRFRKMAEKCSVQFPESQYISMGITRVHPRQKKKLVGQACADLSRLASRAVQFEYSSYERKKREELVEAEAHT